MNYSFSTVLMTILASNLVIILITLCFRFEKLLLTIGYRLLAVFLVLTLIRFIFPFEFPFTKTIYLPEIVSKIGIIFQRPLTAQSAVENESTSFLSLWLVFQAIWFIGCACKLLRHLHDYLSAKRFLRLYGHDISETESIKHILSNICGTRKNSFRIISVPDLPVPQIFGIVTPHILISNPSTLSSEDLHFALQHEAYHHFHHDLLLKELVNLLCIFYWWNPACKSFQQQVNLILEMHVDDSLVHKDPVITSTYLRSLIRIAESTVNGSILPSDLTIALVGVQQSELVSRFQMLCRKHSNASIPLFLLLLTMVASIYLSSHLFILEASSSTAVEQTTNTLGLTENFFAIPQKDGTYNIFYGDVLIENVDNLKYYREIQIQTP